MMYEELAHLLELESATSTRDDYVRAVVEENVTQKRTAATRRHTVQHLCELYAIDPTVPLFRVFRRFWDDDRVGRPLLALLCAFARDPLLRLTVPVVLALRPGNELSRQSMIHAVQAGAGERLNPDSVDKVVRNASSTWTQSGHFSGRMRNQISLKRWDCCVRRRPNCRLPCEVQAAAGGGGVTEWIWKGDPKGVASVDAVIDTPDGNQAMRHRIEFRSEAQKCGVRNVRNAEWKKADRLCRTEPVRIGPKSMVHVSSFKMNDLQRGG